MSSFFFYLYKDPEYRSVAFCLNVSNAVVGEKYSKFLGMIPVKILHHALDVEELLP